MTRTTRTTRTFAALLAGVAALTSACGSDSSSATTEAPAGTTDTPPATAATSEAPGTGPTAATTDAAPADAMQVTLGYYPNSALSLAWFVAQDEGFFAAAGLDVEMIPFKSGPENVAALIGGSTDFGVGGPANVMPPMVLGEPLVAASPALALNYVLVMRADQAGDVPDGYPDSLSVLEGATIGVPALGGAADIFARVLVSAAGLDPDNDVTFVAVGAAATSVPAIIEGQIDALVAAPSTVALIADQGLDVVDLANSLEGTAGDLGDHESAIFGITTADFASSEAMDRYCAAIDEAVNWLHDPANTDRGSALLAEITGLPPTAATAVYELEAPKWRVQIGADGWADDLAWTIEESQDLPYETSVSDCP